MFSSYVFLIVSEWCSCLCYGGDVTGTEQHRHRDGTAPLPHRDGERQESRRASFRLEPIRPHRHRHRAAPRRPRPPQPTPSLASLVRSSTVGSEFRRAVRRVAPDDLARVGAARTSAPRQRAPESKYIVPKSPLVGVAVVAARSRDRERAGFSRASSLQFPVVHYSFRWLASRFGPGEDVPSVRVPISRLPNAPRNRPARLTPTPMKADP